MTAPLLEYGFDDATKAMVDLLLPFVDGQPTRAGSETPEDLQQRLPYLRVTRTGGPTDRVNDFARLTVDVFATTYGAAEPLARKIRDWLTLQGPHRTATVIFDRIGCDSSPQELPWSTSVRRFGATYTAVLRPTRMS